MIENDRQVRCCLGKFCDHPEASGLRLEGYRKAAGTGALSHPLRSRAENLHLPCLEKMEAHADDTGVFTESYKLPVDRRVGRVGENNSLKPLRVFLQRFD